MGRAIVVGLIIGVVLIALLGYWLGRAHSDAAARGLTRAEDLRQLRLLDDAARLMSGMGIGTDPDRIDLLTDGTRRAIADWISRYDRLRKDIDRA